MSARLPAPDFKRLSLCLEQVIHLDTMATHGAFSESVRAALASDYLSLHQLVATRDWYAGKATDGSTLEKALLDSVEASDGPFGWLIKARQPEFIVVDRGEIHFSWTRIREAWFFADDYAAALAAAVEWAEQYHREVWGEDET